VRLSNKVVSLDLALFSKKVENHCSKALSGCVHLHLNRMHGKLYFVCIASVSVFVLFVLFFNFWVIAIDSRLGNE